MKAQEQEVAPPLTDVDTRRGHFQSCPIDAQT